jgi:hypothetical protein
LHAPLFGYGLGSSYQLFFEFVTPDRGLFANASYNHVHFEWLEVLQEGGVVGFAGYFLFWLSVFIFGIRYIDNKANHENNRILMLGLLSGLLAYHIHGFFSVAPRMVVVRSMAYLLVAFVFTLSFKFNKNTELELRRINKTKNSIINFTVISMFLGCSVWLIPYSYGQYQFAKGLAIESQNPNYLVDLALESKDVYALDKASYLLADQKKIPELKIVSERLEEVFPNYRNNLYFQAYAAYLDNDLRTAKEIAKNHQKTDRYNTETNHLLASISLRLDDEKLLKKQFELAVTRLACKTKLIDPCLHENVVPHEGKMAIPIQFTITKNRLHLYHDEKFLPSLIKNVSNGSLGTREAALAYSKLFAQQIGNSKFFIPLALRKRPKELRAALGKYISADESITSSKEDFEKSIGSYYDSNLIKQIDFYYAKQEILNRHIKEARKTMDEANSVLAPNMKVDNFMRKRAFLNQLTQWLAATLIMTKVDTNTFVQLDN